jgi:GNAT superfamily N-acetyltransferase
MSTQPDPLQDVIIRSVLQEETARAERIFRLAFGTYMDFPEPEQFGADLNLIGSRRQADPTRVFGAEYDGKLVGINIASNWGSVGFFGPLAVIPEFWDRKVGQVLMEAVMDQFAAWGNRHLGLFTFPQSPKHIHLYEKFGFFARFLTPIMSKAVAPQPTPAGQWSVYSTLGEGERAAAVTACRELADAVYDGLDLTHEIEATDVQQLGDTVLLLDGSQVTGFAVCHCGEGTEAGTGVCFIKFGAVRPGAAAGRQFTELLSAGEEFAASRGMTTVSGGINLGCEEAYRLMRECRFRTDFIGVAMEQPNEPGYNRPDRYVISDWR